MNKQELIQRIKKQAKRDEKMRQDRRFLDAMGFLVSKGFLRTNLDLALLPNKRLRIDDIIWAGKNVEPRILEVLPAAVLRLRKHFDFDPMIHQELGRIVEQLRRREDKGDAFLGVPYDKVKVWADFPLRDKRVKAVGAKKIVKTFRLNQTAVARLKKKAEAERCTETEILEKMIYGFGNAIEKNPE